MVLTKQSYAPCGQISIHVSLHSAIRASITSIHPGIAECSASDRPLPRGCTACHQNTANRRVTASISTTEIKLECSSLIAIVEMTCHLHALHIHDFIASMGQRGKNVVKLILGRNQNG